jgi:hypothetical protein
MSDSPTGRGYPQGSDSYIAYDVARSSRERLLLVAKLPCTCKGSPFGMDVDRCPVHGKGCT